jgi:hypothetical protein
VNSFTLYYICIIALTVMATFPRQTAYCIARAPTTIQKTTHTATSPLPLAVVTDEAGVKSGYVMSPMVVEWGAPPLDGANQDGSLQCGSA